MTHTDLIDAISRMDGHTKLMLIDLISDTLDEELSDELTEGLGCAFERAENWNHWASVPVYPYGVPQLDAWKVWRAERDRALGAWINLYGRVAA